MERFMNFKEKLVYARAKLDLSQKALASCLNVSYATINRWEKGHNIPTRKAIIIFDEFCKQNNIVFDKEP